MGALFLRICEMSLAASWLILAVLLLRLLLRRAPRWLHGLLWAFVAVRLLCPIFLPSPFSLLPNVDLSPAVGQPFGGEGVPSLATTNAPAPFVDDMGALSLWDSLGILWLLGVLAGLLYAGLSDWRLRRQVRVSLPLENGVWICDHLQAHFVLGLLRPRI